MSADLWLMLLVVAVNAPQRSRAAGGKVHGYRLDAEHGQSVVVADCRRRGVGDRHFEGSALVR